MFWALIKLRPHPSHPVSHSDRIMLKTYFDQDPDDDSDLTEEGGGFTVPVEHTIILPNNSNINCWHTLAEDEYNAPNYDFYIFGEPYASVAFKAAGVHDDLVVGRLKLGPSQGRKMKGSAVDVPLMDGVDADDDIIVFEAQIANSVVQFIVDEMNTNGQAADVQARASDIARERREEAAGDNYWPWQYDLDDAIDDAEDTLGHRTHKNEGWQGTLQDVYFLGGGEWDHKPIIRPIWGAFNRLGNTHAVYFYDGWSNIHFGFIAAMMRLPLSNALAGAGVAQGVDNSTSGGTEQDETGDDPADAQAIEAGYRLGEIIRGRQDREADNTEVTRQDVINILNNHTGWIGRR